MRKLLCVILAIMAMLGIVKLASQTSQNRIDAMMYNCGKCAICGGRYSLITLRGYMDYYGTRYIYNCDACGYEIGTSKEMGY